MRLNNSEVEIVSQNIEDNKDLKVLHIMEGDSYRVVAYIILSVIFTCGIVCLLYTSPSPRDA